MFCQQVMNAAAEEHTTYQVLPDSLPLVNEATDTLGALLLFGCQLAQPLRRFGPFALLGLCLLGLHKSCWHLRTEFAQNILLTVLSIELEVQVKDSIVCCR